MAERFSPRVVLISIDGLLPEFYLTPVGTGYFYELARQGFFSRWAKPVYPTVTYTNHSTLATGCYASGHGIKTNTRFDPMEVVNWTDGESKDWIFETSALKRQPLWSAATDAGIKTAIFNWPITLGAKCQWVFPEIFPIGKHKNHTLWELLRFHMTPDLVHLLECDSRFIIPHSRHDQDHLVTIGTVELLKKRDPGFIMLHLSAIDHEMHENGREHSTVLTALIETENRVREILRNLDLNKTTVFITGDHGFLDFKNRFHINSLFEKQGWLEVSEKNEILDWKVIAHTNCAYAPIFFKDLSLVERARTLLREYAQCCQVISRQKLDELNVGEDCPFAVDTKPGWSLGQSLRGDVTQALPSVRGEHGYLPSYSHMNTGFIAVGAGIKNREWTESIELVDVAPTVAEMLGISLPEAHGKILNVWDARH